MHGDMGISRSPLVKMVLSELERRILEGQYPDGRRLPSEREIADEMAVSRITVRSAIAELERLGVVVCSPRCRPLVQGAKLVPRPAVKQANRHTFALWLRYGPGDPEGPALQLGVQQALDQDNHRLVLGAPFGDDLVVSEAQFLDRMTEDQDVAGLVLWYLGGEANVPALLRARRAGIPMVFVDRLPPHGFEADFVGIDNHYAADRLVSHLLSKGHRNIALINNQDTASTVQDRQAGYRMALKRAGVPYRRDFVLTETFPESNSDDVPANLVSRLLALPERPTAAFCINDRIALSLKAAAENMGLSVPEDLAIVGFDGIERYQPNAFLTTAHQPFDRIGALAVSLLLRRLELGADAPVIHQVLEAPVVLGPSTGD